MTSNPFTAFAELHAPIKTRRRAKVSEREAKRQAKALEERNRLLRAHERWRKQAVAALLARPHGDAVRELLEFLKRMELPAAPGLVELVQSGPWCSADNDTRFLVLVVIDAAFIRIRERADLKPFDDPLPSEQPDAFLILREMLS